MYDFLLMLATQQGAIREVSLLGGTGQAPPLSQAHVFHAKLMGQPVCWQTLFVLWGVGNERGQKIKTAVMSGAEAAPYDMRYMKSVDGSSGSRKTEKWASCLEFWSNIYESVAETLPEEDDLHDGGMNPIMVVDVSSEKSDPYEATTGVRKKRYSGGDQHRWLPKGNN